MKNVKIIYLIINKNKNKMKTILERFISFLWKEIGIHYPISLGKDAKDKFINSEL